MSRINELHEGWMDDPAYRTEYNSLEPEFTLASAMIRAHAEAGLPQEQLVERASSDEE